MQPDKKKNTNAPGSAKGGKGSISLAEMIRPSQWQQHYFFPLCLVILVSLAAYIPVLQNGFVNWDDDRYIYQNAFIHSINLKQIFSSYAVGNYHPLTMLTYALEYRFFGLNAAVYHGL